VERGGRPLTAPAHGGLGSCLASPPPRPYNRAAMTKRSHVSTSVYIFIVLLIGFFLTAVWGVLGMIGLVG
jgi:hypothetical protein